MEVSPTKRNIIKQLDNLTEEQLDKVLRFARTLEPRKETQPSPSKSGGNLLRFVGLIPKDDMNEIAKAIEEDCERIDYDQW
jgi:hypothetical protein